MQNFIYYASLTPDPEDGGFVVRFTDFPEAITQGDSIEESLHEAADCLEEAVANRILMKLDIPMPTEVSERSYAAPLPAPMAAKAALYLAMRELKLTNAEFADRLHRREQDIKRLCDPHEAADMSQIDEALAAIGRRLFIGIQVVHPTGA